MTKYQEFLEQSCIISEDLFNEVVNSLPEYNIKDTAFDTLYEYNSQDEIASEIISSILLKWHCVTCEDVDFEKRIFTLIDVESLEDLEEIKNTFSKWTISNYEECREMLLSYQEEKNKKELIDNFDLSRIPLKDLKEFLNKYDKN